MTSTKEQALPPTNTKKDSAATTATQSSSTKKSLASSSTPPPPSSGGLTSKKALEILQSSTDVLKKVDASPIFTKLEIREFPIFDLSEIEFGPELGTGGYSRVQEITNIHLKKNTNDTNDDTTTKESENKDNDDDDDDDTMNHTKKIYTEMTDEEKLTMIAEMMQHKISHTTTTTTTTTQQQQHHQDDDAHYDITTARETIAKRCIRKGSGARYAVKKLKQELNEIDRARGALDLAIEIRYLKVLWHPNIVKMRGISNTPKVSTETFIVMDRLYGTLESRFEEWEQVYAMTKSCGCCGSVDANDPTIRDFLKTRLLVAYDLSCAFQYLHTAKLIYRDIKPENIGFDIRGDVKVFDFGLCRSLNKVDKVTGKKNAYGYNLTAKTGSIPYMAPEVALGKPYDTQADVFSFSILLWEIVSISWAFNGFTLFDFMERVVKQNLRLPFRGGNSSWPIVLKSIVKEGWDPNPQQRPDMKRIGSLIRGELNELTKDASVLNRTNHMLNLSQRSFRLSFGSGNATSRRNSSSLDGSLSRSITRRLSSFAGMGGGGGGRGGGNSGGNGGGSTDLALGEMKKSSKV